MKSLIIMGCSAALFLGLYACNKDNAVSPSSSSAARSASTNTAKTKKDSLTTVADLPATITSYISTNYAGATIKQAGKESGSGDYVVYLTTADSKNVILLFGSDGTFKKAVTRR